MEKKSVAERIADLFENDGTNFLLPEKTQLEDVLNFLCSSDETYENKNWKRFNFEDGSFFIVGCSWWVCFNDENSQDFIEIKEIIGD